MKNRVLLLLLSALLFFAALPNLASAGDEPVFTLNSKVSHARIGDEVVISIDGSDAKDVYGFELRLAYDPKALTFLEASNDWGGFTVPPIVEDGTITFAHTKIGKIKGENGKVRFAEMRFKAIGRGSTSIELTRAKLVDSELGSTTVEPGVSLKISISGSAPYKDTKGHWAEGDIARATEMGWVNGLPDGRFAPDQEVTRAEFTTMLSRALALSAPLDQVRTFKDQESIPGYAKSHVMQAAAAGWARGYDDGTFRPLQRMTRSEVTVMLMRIVGYEDKKEASPPLPYDDADQVPVWAYPAVAAATDIGLVKGRANNKFAPGGHVSRAEAVVLILRVLDHISTTAE